MEFRTSRIMSQGAVPIPTRKLICNVSMLLLEKQKNLFDGGLQLRFIITQNLK